MIGSQDPRMGNNRRKALAQYLKGQSAQKAGAAGKLKMLNMSALGGRGSRPSGSARPFMRGRTGQANQFTLAANMKPSLKQLLGVVGESMGQGGVAPWQVFSENTPITGLPYSGQVPTSPMGMPQQQPVGGTGQPFGTPYFDPTAPIGQPGGQTTGDAVEGNFENIWNWNQQQPILGNLSPYQDPYNDFRMRWGW